MATVLKIGPADHGRPLALDEFMASDFEEGYQYELVDGELYASPQPNAPQGLIEDWIYSKLKDYSRDHPEVINWVYCKARVFVPGRRGMTNPEPDVTAYRDFPRDQPFRFIRWQEERPLLVVEVLSVDDPDKDLVRNVELYLQVPSIKEYWIVDSREDPDRPGMMVYRRQGKKWRQLEIPFGDHYTTKLLPGFALIVDPHR